MRKAFLYDIGQGITNQIFLDINAGQGPNRLGRDIFVLDMDYENGIKPYGFEMSNEQVKNNCIGGWLGNTCAEYIKRNNWTIPKD
ncbi:hypothetical protein IJ541_09080 [bacterium]|nr:hypothetical protein [bacterium]